MRILCVCLGNICRSPTAEAALVEALEEAGVADQVEVASAGTGSWHVGSPPDPRMGRAAEADGLVLSGTARQVDRSDFETFDLILAMDRPVYTELRDRAPDAAARDKVRLFRDFDPAADDTDVPDPYYLGGFDGVVAICRAGARGVADHVVRELDRRSHQG